MPITDSSKSPFLNPSCSHRWQIWRCFILPGPRFATTSRAADESNRRRSDALTPISLRMWIA
eukprot:10220767-Heterocapsa_arctica.AAC.1